MLFTIKQWKAYLPGCSTKVSWVRWLENAALPLDEALIDVSFLPAMQRRRLTSLAKMVFHVAWPLAKETGSQPFIFSSRHGENRRNLELLTDVAKGAPLSPASFSLSVHNAITGLWSIYRQQTAEMIALASYSDSLEVAVVEAVALLDQGYESVLVVIAEDEQPELYKPYIKDVPYPYAIALEIVKGQDWELLPVTEHVESDLNEHPPALDIISLLLGKATVLYHPSATAQGWKWQRHAIK